MRTADAPPWARRQPPYRKTRDEDLGLLCGPWEEIHERCFLELGKAVLRLVHKAAEKGADNAEGGLLDWGHLVSRACMSVRI